MVLATIITILVGMATMCAVVWFSIRPGIERIRKRKKRMMEILRTRRPWEYMVVSGSTETPSDALHEYAKSGSEKDLRECIAREGFHIDRENKNGETCLMIAVRQNRPNIIKVIINLKARIDAYGKAGTTALHMSAMMGRVDAAKLLIEAKADLAVTMANVDDKDSAHDVQLPLNALVLSLMHGQSAMARLLLESKADSNSAGGKDTNESLLPSSSMSPVHFAVRGGSINSVLLLVEYKANLEDSGEILDGNTPLGYASRIGKMKLVKVLLQCKADPNAATKTARHTGMKPLHFAALGNHPDVMRLLIEHGADRTAKDGNGKHAVDFAIESGSYEATKILDPSQVYASSCNE